MNLIIFILTIIVSFIVVRIGAIAFELTGLEWSLAKFQALSCFSGTGFTTRESELITGHPKRRQIATILIILGNAGIVTLIATFANSLNPNTIFPEIKIPYLDLVVPVRILPAVNFIVILFLLFLIYKFFSNVKVLKIITNFLRTSLIKNTAVKPVSFAELVSTTGGYGVSSVYVSDNSDLIGKTLIQAELRKKDINVLVIERDGESLPNPSPGTKIKKGDSLICFGKLGSIRKVIHSLDNEEV